MPITQSRDFDRRLAGRHTYLGDFEDLSSGLPSLEPESSCVLPVLPIHGLVPMPGITIPLWCFGRDMVPINLALSAANPLSCILVIVNESNRLVGEIACTAQLRQLHQNDDRGLRCLAIGRQRCEILGMAQGQSVRVKILPGSSVHMPKEALDGCLAHPAWVCQLFNAWKLSSTAKEAYQALVPSVPQPITDPESYSYWLASNLPLQVSFKQQLLAEPSTAYRLSNLIHVLKNVTKLQCVRCNQTLAHAKDMLAMSEAGTGSVCVNAYGFVHELMTIREARNVYLEGQAQAENSWFPGYKWTIAHCTNCLRHVGWKFTAAEEGLKPATFYGLRTQSICMPNPARMSSHRPPSENSEDPEDSEGSDYSNNNAAENLDIHPMDEMDDFDHLDPDDETYDFL